MSVNAPLGRVERLWRYPMKSLAAESLDFTDVVASGFAGDRATALFVLTPDRPRSGKPYRGKENALLHTVATQGAAAELARARGLALDPRHGGPYFDLDPVSILFDTWLEGLGRELAMVVDPLRFRPNIFVRAAAEFARAEADLVDRIVRVGSVRLRITGPITRCVTPTYDVATGIADPRLLAYLVRERQNEMGVYAHVVEPGTIAANDAVELEAA